MSPCAYVPYLSITRINQCVHVHVGLKGLEPLRPMDTSF